MSNPHHCITCKSEARHARPYKSGGQYLSLWYCDPCISAVREGRRPKRPEKASQSSLLTKARPNVVRTDVAGEPPEAEKRRVRDAALWTTYRIRLDEFELMLAAQGGVCAICGASEPGAVNWHVDHDHACCSGRRTCGKCVRGVLCHSCNITVTKTLNIPGWWDAAQAYLAKYN